MSQRTPIQCTGEENCPVPNRRQKWYLDRGISIPNMVALVTIMGMAAGWLMKHEGRIVTVEDRTITLEKADEAIKLQRKEDKEDLKKDVSELKELVKEVRDDLKRRR